MRTHNEYVRTAALHGIKMKTKQLKSAFVMPDEQVVKDRLSVQRQAIKKRMEARRKK